MSPIHYRPEIDGLRAVAVLAVIFYHAEMAIFGRDWFQGGYIGVDIFFVISGYLISKIILSELETTKSFSFKNFYERRIRRIMPVLLVVMLTTFPFAWLYLLPADFEEYSKSIIASLFFGSNFFFYDTTTAYGADSSLLKPFLHTWSLSVEEQFYVVFPILAIGLFKYCRKHFVACIATILILSLILSSVMVTKDSDLNFYLLPTRMWELLAGTLLAVADMKRGRTHKTWMHQALPIIGIALIAYTILFFNHGTPHPGFPTILPIIGIALVIFFAGSKDIIGAVLSSKPFVGIGLISYSLYLWHFPIFAFGRMQAEAPTHADKLGWIALTFALSIISYFVVERPFRNRQMFKAKHALLIIAALFVVTFGLNQWVADQDGFEERIPPVLRAAGDDSNYRKLRDDAGLCHSHPSGYCDLGNTSAAKKIILIGDSHMDSISADLYARFDDHYNFKHMTRSSCLFLKDFELSKDVAKDCTIENQRLRSETIKNNPDAIIVMGGIYQEYLSSAPFDNGQGGVHVYWNNAYSGVGTTDTFAQNIKHSIEYALDHARAVIVIYPIPEAGWHIPKRLHATLPNGWWNPDILRAHLHDHPIITDYDLYRARTQSAFAILDSIQHENLYRVYPHELFCDNQIKGQCVTHDDQNLFYADHHHPNETGAKMINDMVMEKVRVVEE